MASSFLSSLSRANRIGLIAGASVVMVAFAVTAWLMLRPSYQVLFSQLSQRDASAMAAELERLKVPFEVADEGSALLVDSKQVHQLRVRLMERDIGLQGTVGFELFNNSDVGMSEFAQRIALLRALQGELTRTVSALGEIETVRVHLALPEESLFKRASQRGKAAITIGLRPGEELSQEQVVGIQRLVAASVPSLLESDVTVVDQRGLALTKRTTREGIDGDSDNRLALKREIEQHLTKKAVIVLDRLLGTGKAVVSVDVELTLDQARVTSEEVLPAASRGGTAPSGVLVRERVSQRDTPTQAPSANSAQSQQRESDYAVGRRVAQVSTPAGAVRRIQVAAVLAASADAKMREEAKALVAAAVGADISRGDTVVVQSIASVDSQDAPAGNTVHAATNTKGIKTISKNHHPPLLSSLLVSLGLVLLFALLAAVTYLIVARFRDERLNRSEREQLLVRLQSWLDQETAKGSA